MDIEKKFIDDTCYIKKETNKQSICLMDSFFSGETMFHLAEKNIGITQITHFLIQRDGTITQYYDTSYYNNHFYSKNDYLNKKSITIAFENYNKLFFDFKTSSYKNFYGLEVDFSEIHAKEFKKFVNDTNTHVSWHTYTSNQLESANYLINNLIKEHLINKKVENHPYFIEKERHKSLTGVYCASNVEMSRYDVNPSFPFKAIKLD